LRKKDEGQTLKFLLIVITRMWSVVCTLRKVKEYVCDLYVQEGKSKESPSIRKKIEINSCDSSKYNNCWKILFYGYYYYMFEMGMRFFINI
jgi:hypothetical protein